MKAIRDKLVRERAGHETTIKIWMDRTRALEDVLHKIEMICADRTVSENFAISMIREAIKPPQAKQ